MRLYTPDAGLASGKPIHLSPDHRRMLLEESGISPEIADERGYRTVSSRAELPEFKKYQRRIGLRLPLYSPDGKASLSQIKPYNPRRDKHGKIIKYETPGGSEMIVDVHPRMRDEARNGDGDLWITEGVKKGDSLTSRGLCAVALPGVWMYAVKDTGGRQLLPCFDHIRLEGRRVYVVYDSDVMAKENVQLALERLVAALEERGADVRVVYLPDGEGCGEKVGVDDYLVAGGTVAELKALARRFEPEDLGRVRLSRDDKLKALVEDLWRTWLAFYWKSVGGHSACALFAALREAAARCGHPHRDGIQVKVSWRTLQERAGIGSSRTLSKAIGRLEEWGLCYRDNEGRKAEKTGVFVLRASVKQVGETGANEEKGSNPMGRFDPGALHLRVALLRWSDPGRKARRGLVKGTRRVRESRLPARPPRKRLGKIRGAGIDVLHAAGGELPLDNLYDVLYPGKEPEKRRPRDLRRRQLPMLERAGIITVDEDLVVRLTDDWLEALENARELGGELEAEDLSRDRHARQRRAYRSRDDVEPDRHHVNAGADGWTEDLRAHDAESEGQDEVAEARGDAPRSAVSDLARAVRHYLDRSPHDACQPPGWIGVMLWADDHYPGKPTPAEIRSAIEELGGEAYLRSRLERSREAA